MTRRRPLLVLAALALVVAACSDDTDPAADTTTSTSTSSTAPVTDGEAATTTTASTSTVPELSTVLALRGDGIGLAAFGERADPVVAAVADVLGDPSRDTGWVDAMSSPYGVCPADLIRGVDWEGLTLLFVDGDSGPSFAGWNVSGAPPALATAAGFGFGATADDAHDLYGQSVELVPAEEPYPAYLEIEADGGTITAFLDGDDHVTNLTAGITCGE